MTRKKFIKTLMAHKVQKYDAVRTAELVGASGASYEQMWRVLSSASNLLAAKKMIEGEQLG